MRRKVDRDVLEEQLAKLREAFRSGDYERLEKAVRETSFAPQEGTWSTFWSGPYEDRANRDRAEAWCDAHPEWTTLERTPAGRVLDGECNPWHAVDENGKGRFSEEQCKKVWEIASLDYADNAEGEVIVFEHRDDGKVGIWGMEHGEHEKLDENLRKNMRVTSIVSSLMMDEEDGQTPQDPRGQVEREEREALRERDVDLDDR